MMAHINLDDRLSILRIGDPFRAWNSLDDQRVCVLCGRKFKGRQVDVRRLPGDKVKVCCPTLGCPSSPDQWHYPTPAVRSDPVQKHCRYGLPNKRQHAPESTLRMRACHV